MIEHRPSEQREESFCERKAPNMLKQHNIRGELCRLYLSPGRLYIQILTGSRCQVQTKSSGDATDQLTSLQSAKVECVSPNRETSQMIILFLTTDLQFSLKSFYFKFCIIETKKLKIYILFIIYLNSYFFILFFKFN